MKGFQNNKIQAKQGATHKRGLYISGTIWPSIFPCPQVPTFGWPSPYPCPCGHTLQIKNNIKTQKHQHYLQINRLLLAFIIPHAWSFLGPKSYYIVIFCHTKTDITATPILLVELNEKISESNVFFTKKIYNNLRGITVQEPSFLRKMTKIRQIFK